MSNKKHCTCDKPFSDCIHAMETPHGDKWYCTLADKLKENMLKIFAKLNTDEKVAIYCHAGQTQAIKIKLQSEFGGDWMAVDECLTGGEILKFNDGQTYKGYDNNVERYSTAIKKFNPYR